MLNQKIAMTHKENADVLKKISEVDSLTVIEELKQASLNDESENFILDDLEREYAKELAALTEKINNYKEVFQIDIQSNKGKYRFCLMRLKKDSNSVYVCFLEKKFVWITFMGAEQTIKIEYKNIKSIKAFVEEFSDKVVEAEKDEAIKKLVKQFNSLKDVKPNITDFIVKLSEQLKNV